MSQLLDLERRPILSRWIERHILTVASERRVVDVIIKLYNAGVNISSSVTVNENEIHFNQFISNYNYFTSICHKRESF
jgi:hypothetical protein